MGSLGISSASRCLTPATPEEFIAPLMGAPEPTVYDPCGLLSAKSSSMAEDAISIHRRQYRLGNEQRMGILIVADCISCRDSNTASCLALHAARTLRYGHRIAVIAIAMGDNSSWCAVGGRISLSDFYHGAACVASSQNLHNATPYDLRHAVAASTAFTANWMGTIWPLEVDVWPAYHFFGIWLPLLVMAYRCCVYYHCECRTRMNDCVVCVSVAIIAMLMSFLLYKRSTCVASYWF